MQMHLLRFHQVGQGRPSPALTQFLDAVNVFMCNILGPGRQQFLADMLPAQDRSFPADCRRYHTVLQHDLTRRFLV
jgi:hypothetical protein